MRPNRFLEVCPQQDSPSRHRPEGAAFKRRKTVYGLLCAVWLMPLLTFAAVVSPQQARAQGAAQDSNDNPVSVAYPLPGNTLTGASKILFSGVPDGGYVSVYVDMTPTNKAQSFRLATTQNSYELDAGALSEGKHVLTLISFSASGRQVGIKTVPFNVKNVGSAGISEDSVSLVNWTARDVVAGKVQRYRVFAVSDATITGDTSAMSGSSMSGSSMSMGGSPGGSSASAEPTPKPAPLDHQVDLLLRRVVREVGMIDGSANVRMVVQDAFDRKRMGSESSSGGSGGSSMSMGSSGSSGPSSSASSSTPLDANGKAIWNKTWNRAPETGQAYTKMIKPNGDEILITKKPATLPLGDILPTFPAYRVQKGATWNSDIVIVGELSKREPHRLLNVPVSLTGFENVSTPAGFERRCAKIEIAQFSLPDDMAKKIATALQSEAGSSAGAGSSGGSPGGSPGGMSMSGSMGGSSGASAEPPKILNSRATLTRTIWFDIAAHQMVRSEDTVDAYYEEEAPPASSMGGSGSMGGYSGMSGGYPSGGSMGGGYPGGGYPGMSGGYPGSSPGMSGGYPGGGYPGSSSGMGGYPGMGGMPSVPVAPPEPKTVTYNLRVIKFLDDRLPKPTSKWTGGAGTAHARDSTRNPSLTRANGDDVNNR